MHLDAKTRAFIQAQQAQSGPPLHKRPIPDARQLLENAQFAPAHLAPAQIEKRVIQGGPTGEVRLVIVRPEAQVETLPALLYLHGGGWILGDWHTHERLVRELAAAIPAVVVFVDYAPSPEQRFPVALEQSYEALRWLVLHAAELDIDAARLAVVGDSAGASIAVGVALLANEWNGPKIGWQVLFYPVTDANFETPSYREFAHGTNLTKDAMQWFWDAYVPDTAARTNPLCAPLQATPEALASLPTALIITGENDVLRDEGEAFAHKLAEAEVDVTAIRYLGTVHDFVMLNALADTPAAISAVAQTIDWLRRAFEVAGTEGPRPGVVSFLPGEAAEAERRRLG